MRDECLQQGKVELGVWCRCACVCLPVRCKGKSMLMSMLCSFYLASAAIHHLVGSLSAPKTTQMCSEGREQASVSVHV